MIHSISVLFTQFLYTFCRYYFLHVHFNTLFELQFNLSFLINPFYSCLSMHPSSLNIRIAGVGFIQVHGCPFPRLPDLHDLYNSTFTSTIASRLFQPVYCFVKLKHPPSSCFFPGSTLTKPLYHESFTVS